MRFVKEGFMFMSWRRRRLQCGSIFDEVRFECPTCAGRVVRKFVLGVVEFFNTGYLETPMSNIAARAKCPGRRAGAEVWFTAYGALKQFKSK